MVDEEKFKEELRQMFATEAEEHLQAISDGLLAMEKSCDPEAETETLETVYRAVHSLKGAARAVGSTEIEGVCQATEDIFSLWKRGEVVPERPSFDNIYRAIDSMRQMLSAPGADATERDELIARLALLADGTSPVADEQTGSGTAASVTPQEEASTLKHEPPAPKTVPAAMSTEDIRIKTSKLDSLLLKAEQMLTAKLRATQRVSDVAVILDSFAVWSKEWARVRSLPLLPKRLDDAHDAPHATDSHANSEVLQFLRWNESFLAKLQAHLRALQRSVADDRQTLGAMVDDLLGNAKTVLMLPFATMLRVFPRMVRDISSDQYKEVELNIHGEEVEVDKRILEALKDPMTHLVRNCIDHGIETPDERERVGKPRVARITVSASQVSGNRVEVVVSDDGRGIDLQKLRSKVIREGVATEAEFDAMSEADRLLFVFRSGVSTSTMITDVSGRGLGLAIVREKAEELGGTVTVESAHRKGATFRFMLPSTLATFRAVIVETANRGFAIPTASVKRITRISSSDIQTMQNRETVVLGDEPISLVRLDDLLELPRTAGNANGTERLNVMVLAAAGKEIAFVVDAVRAEQEVLVKTLGPQLVRVRNIGGATVLGSGQVIPIVNVLDLITSAVERGARSSSQAASVQDVPHARSVLVAEDSITSRAMLRNILESAGYSVTTAIDGAEALATLKTGEFAAVVSDVEMPRMDGCQLTEQIRGDARLADLPVVLVTARESQADRERGVEAGANAYIVKSSFDQSNLLEVVGRLL